MTPFCYIKEENKERYSAGEDLLWQQITTLSTLVISYRLVKVKEQNTSSKQ